MVLRALGQLLGAWQKSTRQNIGFPRLQAPQLSGWRMVTNYSSKGGLLQRTGNDQALEVLQEP